MGKGVIGAGMKCNARGGGFGMSKWAKDEVGVWKWAERGWWWEWVRGGRSYQSLQRGVQLAVKLLQAGHRHNAFTRGGGRGQGTRGSANTHLDRRARPPQKRCLQPALEGRRRRLSRDVQVQRPSRRCPSSDAARSSGCPPSAPHQGWHYRAPPPWHAAKRGVGQPDGHGAP